MIYCFWVNSIAAYDSLDLFSICCLQVVDKGKQILHSVACTSLEKALTELAEKWVELNAQLGQELKK